MHAALTHIALIQRLLSQANLRVVLTLVAQLRGTPEAELVRLAWDNARRFYRICLDEDDAP